MSKDYVLSMDLGTSSATAMLCTLDPLEPKARASVALKQFYPKPSWVEQDLEELWQAMVSAIKQAIAQLKAPLSSSISIACIGITNQRETLCVFDRKTAKPIAPAISWQCNRSTQICQELQNSDKAKYIQKTTGLSIDPYFTGSKILWLTKHHPHILTQLQKKHAVLGTIDTYLLMRLTQGTIATEPSNASRTMLLGLEDSSWNEELLQIFSVPSQDVLGQILPSNATFGKTRGVDGLADGIPITGMLGDQQAALLGQLCLKAHEAKCTYGTGAFLLVNTGEKPVPSSSGLLTTIAWQLGEQRYYALEGSSFIAGSGVNYLRDTWKFFANAEDTTAMAKHTKASPNIHFVPAFSGLGAPYWQPKAKAALLGLSLDTTKEEITRSMLEGIAFSVAELIEAAENDLKSAITSLKVDGGVSQNDELIQFQADISHLPIIRPQKIESTALGAAIIAICGLTQSFPNFANSPSSKTGKSHHFHPNISPQERKQHLASWRKAVNACLSMNT